MAIIKLSDSTINLIAAGEVVERPSSVVKELVENSIDAGATKIEIYLEQAGKNVIVVADNGGGMSGEDMLIAVERHTTSKLDELDILNIRSFGFRGEALPSIMSVSKLSITSKKNASDSSFKLHSVDNKLVLSEVVHNAGTKIEVRDLFYSVPARLKFLKSNQTELSNCLEIVKRLALSSPHIAFSVKHEDKLLLNLPVAEDIKSRIKDILGEDFDKNSVEVELSNEFITVYGYVSLPTYHRASGDEQFVFVNTRPVKDKLLSGSIKAAYQDYIVHGRFAPLVLFLDVPYQFVDVNVHPAKNEVRFQDASKIRNAVVNAIKNSISGQNIGVSTTYSDQAINYFTHSQPRSGNSYNNAPVKDFSEGSHILSDHEVKYRSLVRPSITSDFKVDEQTKLNIFSAPQSYIPAYSKTETDFDNSTANFHSGMFELGYACAQLHNNYVIAQTKSGIVVVDQHAAHERIVYEQLKKQLETQPLTSQKLLLPLVVELSSMKKAQYLDTNKEELAKLAMVLEKLNDTKIIVHEVPSILIKDDINKLIHDIADEFCESQQEFSLTRLIEHVIETYACHHSIRSGQKLSINEMNDLLRQIELTPGGGQCCHGRPTYVTMTLCDLEKLFCRK
jgi:DNA mismatch repair protein MutL